MSNARTLSISVLLISIIASFFIIFNGTDNNVKISMFGYVAAAVTLIVFISRTPKGWGLSLVGESITPDVIKGVAVGIGFIFLNNLNNALSLGAPAALLSLEPTFLFLAIVIVAPIVEEFLFRCLVYPQIYGATKNNFIAIPLQAAIFAFFHFAVYGGFFALKYSPGVFIGAFVFAVVMGLLVMRHASSKLITTLEAPIIAHMIFNAYLLNQTTQYLAVLA